MVRTLFAAGVFAAGLSFGLLADTRPAEAHPTGFHHCHARPVCGWYIHTQRRRVTTCAGGWCRQVWRVTSRNRIYTCARCHN